MIKPDRRDYAVLVWAACVTAVSICLAAWFLPQRLLLASSALIAIGLTPTLHIFLDENRKAIWELQEDPRRANARIALQIVALFLGVLVASLIVHAVWHEPLVPASATAALYRNTFLELLRHNFAVLFGGFAFSLIYRAGGIMLVLAWNALNWSVSFVDAAGMVAGNHTMLTAGLYVLILIPHLLFEVLAYVLAGIAGIFLSKGIQKYSLKSENFWRVATASTFILGGSLVALVISAAIEVFLAANAFEAIRAG